ncbi:MAG: hypothetical protein BWY66_00056 [bacterium ADurb.Bin374]|nr:MAG: hypothetical protein BWY66_00056 [bacterium ADurb.Bin374]
MGNHPGFETVRTQLEIAKSHSRRSHEHDSVMKRGWIEFSFYDIGECEGLEWLLQTLTQIVDVDGLARGRMPGILDGFPGGKIDERNPSAADSNTILSDFSLLSQNPFGNRQWKIRNPLVFETMCEESLLDDAIRVQVIEIDIDVAEPTGDIGKFLEGGTHFFYEDGRRGRIFVCLEFRKHEREHHVAGSGAAVDERTIAGRISRGYIF